MKKVFVAIALTTFVGSMATTAYAAVNGLEIVKKDDDKRKKKKKSGSCSSSATQNKVVLLQEHHRNLAALQVSNKH
jgi:hypothetical protein